VTQTVMMETKLVSETLVLNSTLARLIIRQNCVKYRVYAAAIQSLFLKPLMSELCRYNFASLHGVEPRGEAGAQK
jgi:hypothetical protein